MSPPNVGGSTPSRCSASPDPPPQYRLSPIAFYRLPPIYFPARFGYSARDLEARALSQRKRGIHMNHCHLAENCFFFAVREEGREMREYLTGLYCTGNFSDCARYRAAMDMGQRPVPDDIFPNEDVFVSLFAWAFNQRQIPVSKQRRTRCPGRLPVSAPEKTAASSGHLPPTRQTHNQR